MCSSRKGLLALSLYVKRIVTGIVDSSCYWILLRQLLCGTREQQQCSVGTMFATVAICWIEEGA